MTESAAATLLIPEPAPEQIISVEGARLDPAAGLSPRVVVHMPYWRAQSLGDVLTRWTQVTEIMEGEGPAEQVLADDLLTAGEVGRSLRKSHAAANGLELPKRQPNQPQTVTVEGTIRDGHDHTTVPCVVMRMSWHRAEALAQVFDRWTQMAAIVDESDGSDESVLAAELQKAAETGRSLRQAGPTRAVLNGAHEVGQAGAEGGGKGAEPVE